jgi:hypothetical protein
MGSRYMKMSSIGILWWFFKKLKIELPYDPEILPLGIYLKEMKPLH